MPAPGNHKTERRIVIAILVFAIAFVVLFVFLVRDYRALRRAQILNAREFWLAAVLKNHGVLPASDVTSIRSWMTFDYVNKLFGLPPDYLKTTLSVIDVRYPRLSFSAYAKTSHLDPSSLLGETERAIGNYKATASGAATTTAK